MLARSREDKYVLVAENIKYLVLPAVVHESMASKQRELRCPVQVCYGHNVIARQPGQGCREFFSATSRTIGWIRAYVYATTLVAAVAVLMTVSGFMLPSYSYYLEVVKINTWY